VSAPRFGRPLAAELDESEQSLERAAGRCAAAPLISRRLHWPEPTPAPDDTRARRPCACRRPRPRAHTGGRGRTSGDRPECGRANPSPTATSVRACAPCERTTGRRRPPPRHPAARHRRPSRGADGPPQPARRAPSSPARRPDRLAFYMGYCPHRRKGHVSCGARRPEPVAEVQARPTRLLVVSGRRPAGAGPGARVSSNGRARSATPLATARRGEAGAGVGRIGDQYAGATSDSSTPPPISCYRLSKCERR